MLLIETDGIRILYTGDFREHGIAGSRDRFEKMIRAYVGNVDLLITEGTILSRAREEHENAVRTEDELGKRAGDIFRKNRQTAVLVSSTNLDSTKKSAKSPDAYRSIRLAYLTLGSDEAITQKLLEKDGEMVVTSVLTEDLYDSASDSDHKKILWKYVYGILKECASPEPADCGRP